jgi:flavin-binding protein dodecin
LRVAEIVELDMQLDNGKVEAYRAKVRVSFKFEGKD